VTIGFIPRFAALGARKNIILVKLDAPQDVLKVLRHRDHR
jgi:hypothetical protein